MASETNFYDLVNTEFGTSQSSQYGFKVNRIDFVRHLMGEICESGRILIGHGFQNPQ